MKLILIFLFFISCSQTPVRKYNRASWIHWSDHDRDCQNTRQEILIERSLKPVTLNKRGCTVLKGEWKDYYYPETHTLAKKVDIDHLVPLKNAHLSGGADWGQKQKEKFANDPENLVITNLKYNRQKGASGIDRWLPVDKTYACRYIRDWIKIKKKYGLKLLPTEAKTRDQILCR